MPKTSQAIIRNRGGAIFRIIFGSFFIALGVYRHFQEGVPSSTGLFTLAIGLLFVGHGLYVLIAGSSVKIEIPTSETTSPTERLAAILKLKNEGLITEQEYEAKRQDILKNI